MAQPKCDEHRNKYQQPKTQKQRLNMDTTRTNVG